uniref:Uncharacterized protein n=1 Tax=Anguilla anguilla TaxID=7936 RepID=A0A0E9T1M0_ANGAN
MYCISQEKDPTLAQMPSVLARRCLAVEHTYTYSTSAETSW